MSADTGTSIAATIRAMTAAARSAPRPAPSGTPRDQATPALVVAIALAPAPAIATAEATSHAFGSSSGSPGLCRLAKARAVLCLVHRHDRHASQLRSGELAGSGQAIAGSAADPVRIRPVAQADLAAYM